MTTCPYCGSVLVFDTGFYFCSFCQMSIAPTDVLRDGSRKPLVPNSFVCADYAELSTPELLKKSTYFLVYLLRLVRRERKSKYNYLRLFNKVMDTGANEFQEVAQESRNTYEWWTRKAWVIENILRDRMDHFPDRITDQYLFNLAKHMQQTSQKAMIISRERKHCKISRTHPSP